MNINFRCQEAESREGKGEIDYVKGKKKKKKTQNTTSDAKRNDEKGKKFSKVRP